MFPVTTMTHTATAARRALPRQTALVFPVRRLAPTRGATEEPPIVISSRNRFEPQLFGQRQASRPGPTGTAQPAPLVGIARLAAVALKDHERNEVEYFRLPVRSVLNRVESARVDFEWSINPYRGCEFGCGYCYARYTHRYMELDHEAFDAEQGLYVLRRGSSQRGIVTWLTE